MLLAPKGKISEIQCLTELSISTLFQSHHRKNVSPITIIYKMIYILCNPPAFCQASASVKTYEEKNVYNFTGKISLP